MKFPDLPRPGELMRESYIELLNWCRANNVTVLGTPGAEQRKPVDPNNQELRREFAPQHDDLDDSIPF